MSGNSFLNNLKNEEPNLSDKIEEIQSLYDQKLWHNVTEKLETFILQVPQDKLLGLYEKFLADFELKINLYSLAKFVVYICQNLKDEKKAMTLLEDVAKKCEEKQNPQASLILRLGVSVFLLRMKEFNSCKELLAKSKEVINNFGYHIENNVHSAYYRSEAEYFKGTDSPNEFYKSELLYLAYTPLESLPTLEQQRIAFDLGIAALIGDKIYNFGELLGHPVVNSLQGSKAEWLLKLLIAFNRGDVHQYHNITKQAPLTQVLIQKSNFLAEKMQIMSLMELVFNRLAGDRTITFDEIKKVTETNDVEVLLLKALSLTLIKGAIDEVTKTIYVNWVQPRVLDLDQVDTLKKKIGNWLEKVKNTLSFLEKEGKLSLEEPLETK